MVQEKNETIQKKEVKFKHKKLDKTEVHIDEALKSKNIEILEDIITGDNATHFYMLLKNPPKNPKREEKIKESLQLFPEPDKPSEIDIEL
jgi:hypothetical protein